MKSLLPAGLSEVENLIDQIQGDKDNRLCVVNVDKDKGEIDTREFEECDNDNDIVFIPNEYISPPRSVVVLVASMRAVQ